MLRQKAPAAAFHMVQSGEGNWPPLGVLFGLPYTSIYYWCTDQVIVQVSVDIMFRFFFTLIHSYCSARCLLEVYSTARCSYDYLFLVHFCFKILQAGILAACMLKLLLPFIMVVPGIISSVLSESVRSDPNTAFPALIIAVVPSPLMGVICAAVLAALMYGSSVALPVTRSRYVHVVNRLRIQQRGNHFHG
jgi:uncharacterized sodium:solute symporter family permease YidK